MNGNDIEQRNALFEEYLPDINKMISQSLRKGALVSRDDLLSAAFVAFPDILDRYVTTKGCTFKTYLCRRLYGLFVDVKKSVDMLPRYARKDVEELPDKWVEKHPSRLQQPKMFLTDLWEQIDTRGNTLTLTWESVIPNNEEDQLSEVIRKETEQMLIVAVNKLKPQYKLVIHEYFWNDKPLKEIGKMINVSESRASQIKTDAIKELKKHLNGNLKHSLRP